MLDSTKSPTPAWQRYLVAGLLTVLVVVVGYFVYTKDLHHPAAASGSASSHPAVAAPAPTSTTSTPPTTIPGGIAVSNRDPFTATP